MGHSARPPWPQPTLAFRVRDRKAVKVSGQLQPRGIAITPDGKTTYAVGSVLTPIRTATNTALTAIQLGGWGIIVVVIR